MENKEHLNHIFIVKEDYTFKSGYETLELKKGDEITYNDLLKVVGGFHGRLKFVLTCTKLKDILEKTEEAYIEYNSEELPENILENTISPMFLVNQDIKKGRKVIFKEEEKITLDQIEQAGFEIADLLNTQKIMEIKVTGDVQI